MRAFRFFLFLTLCFHSSFAFSYVFSHCINDSSGGLLSTFKYYNTRQPSACITPYVVLQSSEAATVESNYLACSSQLTTLQSDKSALQAQVSTLQSQLQATSTCSSQVTTLQAQVVSLQSDKAALQSQLATLQSQVATLQTEKASLQTQTATLQAQVSTLQSTLSQPSTPSLTSSNQSMVCPSIWSFSGSYEDARQLGTVIFGLFAIVFVVVSVKKFFL